MACAQPVGMAGSTCTVQRRGCVWASGVVERKWSCGEVVIVQLTEGWAVGKMHWEDAQGALVCQLLNVLTSGGS